MLIFDGAGVLAGYRGGENSFRQRPARFPTVRRLCDNATLGALLNRAAR
jgi:hypothetical protein